MLYELHHLGTQQQIELDLEAFDYGPKDCDCKVAALQTVSNRSSHADMWQRFTLLLCKRGQLGLLQVTII